MSNRTIQAAVIAPDGQRHHITVTAAAPGPLDQGIATISNASLQAALKAPPHKSEPPSIPHRPDTICPDCDGAGFYKEAVPFGHPNFSKLLPCHCKLADQQVYARKRQTEILDKLQGELGGRLSRATFQNYTIPHDYELRERQKLQAARQAFAELLGARRYADRSVNLNVIPAYARFLRANGVALSKQNFLGHLAPYMFAPPVSD